ncbi:MAG TPA: hypothetical protein VK422_11600 [Pyrinomonadaceae bacterium]|nr:hypothetical protein [Pyrinomonadaceae bacterium]
MTSDELERAIDFLLKSGAHCDARLAQLSEEVTRISGVVDRLSEKVDRISEKVDRQSDDFAQLSARQDSYADTQAHIMQVMMQTYERQAEINKSLRESMRKEDNELREYIRGVAAAGAATDRRLNALIEAMDRGRDAGR